MYVDYYFKYIYLKYDILDDYHFLMCRTLRNYVFVTKVHCTNILSHCGNLNHCFFRLSYIVIALTAELWYIGNLNAYRSSTLSGLT